MAGLILNSVEMIKKRMPCGFPKFGVPPLAPLQLNNQSVDFDYRNSMARGHVDELVLTGLNEFEFSELSLSLAASELVFRVKFDGLNLKTLYDLKMKLDEFGLELNVEGNGSAEIDVSGIELWGNVKFAVNLAKGKISIKSLNLKSHVDKVFTDIQGVMGDGDVNGVLNTLLPDLIQWVANDEENQIVQTIIENVGLPMINEMLAQVSLDDLMNMMPGEDDYEDEC